MLRKEEQKAYKKFLEERFAEFGRHLAEMEQNNGKSQNSHHNIMKMRGNKTTI